MGREVRRVPATWVHPRKHGRLQPLFGRSWREEQAAWDEKLAKWNEGLVRGYGAIPWEPKPQAALECLDFAAWDGNRPQASDYMPDWKPEERTHYQMYETTSEGTPISPVFATPEDLARWLSDTDASVFAGSTLSYEDWLRAIKTDDPCLPVAYRTSDI